MSVFNECQTDQSLSRLFRYLLLQAEIPVNYFYAATEPGRIVITKSPEKSGEDTKGDMIFEAVDFILKYADKDALHNVLYTIQSELAERWSN